MPSQRIDSNQVQFAYQITSLLKTIFILPPVMRPSHSQTVPASFHTGVSGAIQTNYNKLAHRTHVSVYHYKSTAFLIPNFIDFRRYTS